MFTLTQARRAINNTAFFARGRAYADEGRVQNLRVDTDGPRLECSATVRGHGEYYSVSFTYDQETGTFPACECLSVAHPLRKFVKAAHDIGARASNAQLQLYLVLRKA